MSETVFLDRPPFAWVVVTLTLWYPLLGVAIEGADGVDHELCDQVVTVAGPVDRVGVP